MSPLILFLFSVVQQAHARRTVFFVMLAGLAWTDLLGQLATGPVPIVMYLNNLQWVGGMPLCIYHGFIMISISVVTHLIVGCMSLERFLAIRFSYYYARRVSRFKAQMTFLICWVVTLLFASLPFLNFGSYEHQFPGSWCFLSFHSNSTTDAIFAGSFSMLNIISTTVMIICNTTVVITLLRVRKRRSLEGSPSAGRKVSVGSNSGALSAQGNVIRKKKHSDMEAQMIWFLGLITVAFSVCWLPLSVRILFAILCHCQNVFHNITTYSQSSWPFFMALGYEDESQETMRKVHILITQITGVADQSTDLIVVRMAGFNQILDPWLYVIFRKSSITRFIRRLKRCFYPKVLNRAPPRRPPYHHPRYVVCHRFITSDNPILARAAVNGLVDRAPRHWTSPMRDSADQSGPADEDQSVHYVKGNSHKEGPEYCQDTHSDVSSDSSSNLIQVCPYCSWATDDENFEAFHSLARLSLDMSPTATPVRPRRFFSGSGKKSTTCSNAACHSGESEPRDSSQTQGASSKSDSKTFKKKRKRTESERILRAAHPSLHAVASLPLVKLVRKRTSKRSLRIYYRRPSTDQTELSSEISERYKSRNSTQNTGVCSTNISLNTSSDKDNVELSKFRKDHFSTSSLLKSPPALSEKTQNMPVFFPTVNNHDIQTRGNSDSLIADDNSFDAGFASEQSVEAETCGFQKSEKGTYGANKDKEHVPCTDDLGQCAEEDHAEIPPKSKPYVTSKNADQISLDFKPLTLATNDSDLEDDVFVNSDDENSTSKPLRPSPKNNIHNHSTTPRDIPP
ncbi:uncharacterized protein LOC101863285 [Aplysia californica]|uniref:Thromboxane A2 receptor n=1 Tax=Aplysia californica TaxID=6500 RepID=A0ABM1VXW2_APLCA|nr:uncharacterized protein LOC101863285 [Aplysia californica]